MKRITFPKHEWDERIQALLSSWNFYAPVENEFSCDYALLDAETVPDIVYNKPKPVTPLKKFFLPIKENVTTLSHDKRPVVVIGAPNCDVMALALLDRIYMDQEYYDPAYGERRERTTIITSDCFSIQEHCHCTSYGIEPRGNEHSDLSVALIGDQVILTVFNKKGDSFIDKLGMTVTADPGKPLMEQLENKHQEVVKLLDLQNEGLPDTEETGRLISANGEDVWKKYARDCVSCGACSAICPSCSCFLLVDQPGFQKIRQLDTCQYPGFERVAGGEDALGPLPERFKNRYLCKYVWKPRNYQLNACTGCGRCIETCIGQINKNELIMELSN